MPNKTNEFQRRIYEYSGSLIYFLANKGTNPPSEKSELRQKLIDYLRSADYNTQELITEAETAKDSELSGGFQNIRGFVLESIAQIESSTQDELNELGENIIESYMRKVDELTEKYREDNKLPSLFEGLTTLRDSRRKFLRG